MTDETLKLCPDQCAEGKPELIETYYMEGPVKVRCKQVRCSCCGIAAPMAETIADAVEAWSCLQLNTRASEAAEPIDCLLFCPKCGNQHVDAPEPENGWTNPPHKSHLCHGCGCIWRPAEVPTNGVESIAPGGRDNWNGKAEAAKPVAWGVFRNGKLLTHQAHPALFRYEGLALDFMESTNLLHEDEEEAVTVPLYLHPDTEAMADRYFAENVMPRGSRKIDTEARRLLERVIRIRKEQEGRAPTLRMVRQIAALSKEVETYLAQTAGRDHE